MFTYLEKRGRKERLHVLWERIKNREKKKSTATVTTVELHFKVLTTVYKFVLR